MVNTSKDLLFIILGVSIGLLAIFLTWALYYIVMMLKKANEVMKDFKEMINGVKEKINRLEDLINKIEEKISNTASYLPLIMKGVTELIEYIKKRKEARKNKKAK